MEDMINRLLDPVKNAAASFCVRFTDKLRAYLCNKKRRRLKAALLFFRSVYRDDIPAVAAETAFFLLLSLFPLIAVAGAVLAKYSDVIRNEIFGYILPGSVAEVLVPLIKEIEEKASLSLVSLLVSLWSASTGIWALMRGICKAYTGQYPQKPFFKRLIAPLFVLVFLVVVAFGLAGWVIGESLVYKEGRNLSLAVSILKYAGVFAGIMLFNLGLYAYTPGYDLNKRCHIPGAIAASCGWMLANRGFEIYIRDIINYSALYGSIGAFLGLVLWLFAISMVILFGAEINAAVFSYRAGEC